MVSSGQCVILSNLAVQSVSQSVKKTYQMFKTKGGGGKGDLNNVKKTAKLVKREIPDMEKGHIFLFTAPS